MTAASAPSFRGVPRACTKPHILLVREDANFTSSLVHSVLPTGERYEAALLAPSVMSTRGRTDSLSVGIVSARCAKQPLIEVAGHRRSETSVAPWHDQAGLRAGLCAGGSHSDRTAVPEPCQGPLFCLLREGLLFTAAPFENGNDRAACQTYSWLGLGSVDQRRKTSGCG
jgi:hypothetical protein